MTGRWLSKDPIGISGGLNQYVFCRNNPLNMVDPFGLCSEGVNEGIIGAAGVLEQAGQVRYNYNSLIAVGAGGASAGAWAGAAIGTAIAPGPGSAIGAVVGAIIGGVGGGVGGHALGTAAYDANYGPNSPW